MGGGEGEMERGGGERGQEGRVRNKEMDGETDRDEWLRRRADQHMTHKVFVCLQHRLHVVFNLVLDPG